MLYAYSRAADGGSTCGSHFFRVREFACKDGSDTVFVDSDLVAILHHIRCHYGKPVNINSAYRTDAHNKAEGGSPRSQHKLGKAADITVRGVSPSALYEYLDKAYPDSCGIGLYKTFVHVDCRKNKNRWRY